MMSENLARMGELTDQMSSANWVDSRLTFCHPSWEGIFGDVVRRSPQYTILQWMVPAGSCVGTHTHEDAEEILVCVLGEIAVHVDGKLHEMQPGDSLTIPRGVPHGGARPQLVDSLVIGITIPPAKEFDEPTGDRNAQSDRRRPPGDAIAPV